MTQDTRDRARINRAWHLLPTAAIAAMMGLIPLCAPQAWYHLAIGRIIHLRGAIPDANHFLYSLPPETPSFILEWLSARAMFILQDALGVELLLTTRNLSLAIAVCLTSLAVTARAPDDDIDARWRALLVLGGALIALQGIWATPILFAAPLFAILLLASARIERASAPWQRALWLSLFPASAALWANLDMGCGLPGVVAAWCGVRSFVQSRGVDQADTTPGKPDTMDPPWWVWGAVALASWAAIMLNPRGVAIYAHIIEVMSLYPGSLDAGAQWSRVIPGVGAAGVTLLLGIIGVIGASVAAWRRGWRPRLADTALAIALFALAMHQQRGMLWLGLALPVLLAPLLGTLCAASKAPSSGRIWRALGVTASLLVALSMQPVLLTHAPIAARLSPYNVRQVAPHRGVLQDTLPLEAVEFLAQTTERPRIWASPEYEPYLLFRLLDERPVALVFADPRQEMLPEKTREVRDLIEEQEGLWRGMFQGWGVSAVLLARGERHSALRAQLMAHPAWMIAHEDDLAVYFVKVTSVTP